MLWKKAIIKRMLDKALHDLDMSNVNEIIDEMLEFLNDPKQKRRLISKDRTDILQLLGIIFSISTISSYSESIRDKTKEEFRSLITIQLERLVSLIYNFLNQHTI